MSKGEPVEIGYIMTAYADDIGTVDLMPSGNTRVTFVEDQRADRTPMQVIVARFAIPHDALVQAALVILREAERHRLPLISQDRSDARH